MLLAPPPLLFSRAVVSRLSCCTSAIARAAAQAVRPSPGRRRRLGGSSSSIAAPFSSSAPAPPSDPLRVLFCGSDEFSCAALRALHGEQQQQRRRLVESIDVVVRPAKPTGRGLRTLREVPLKILASELGLPVHERDTFTGWEPPPPPTGPINLIIAVSFGLLVPPRLLRQAKYGGLNIHPSLLPDLRGPAPLQHALLRGDTSFALTLQTLHPTAFDHGAVLARSAGHRVPDDCTAPTTTDSLRAFLAPLAADLLVRSLRAGLHVPPYPEPPPQSAAARGGGGGSGSGSGSGSVVLLQPAPKITKADLQVPWLAADADAEAVARRARALGPLWTRAVVVRGGNRSKGKGKTGNTAAAGPSPTVASKRIILEGVETADVSSPEIASSIDSLLLSSGSGDGSATDKPAGIRAVTFLQESSGGSSSSGEGAGTAAVVLPVIKDGKDDSVMIPLGLARQADSGEARGKYLRIRTIKVEGDKAKPAAKAIDAFAEDVSSLRADGRDFTAEAIVRQPDN